MLKKTCPVSMIKSQIFSDNAIVKEVLTGNYYVALRATYGNKLFDAGIEYSPYDNMLTAYNLYVTSEDPIEDSYFLTPDNTIFSAKQYEAMPGDKKIIGTTDKILIADGVDQLRTAFVEIYTRSLNSKDVIKTVEVQYTEEGKPLVRKEGTIVTYRTIEQTVPISKVKEVAHDAWIESFFLKRNTDITGFEDWFSKYFNL